MQTMMLKDTQPKQHTHEIHIWFFCLSIVSSLIWRKREVIRTCWTVWSHDCWTLFINKSNRTFSTVC